MTRMLLRHMQRNSLAYLAPLVIAFALLFLGPVGSGRASFPGSTGQIVVSESWSGVGLDALDPDGTNSRRIWTATSPPGCGPCPFSSESSPSWSPDGTRVVFVEWVQIEIMPVAQGIAVVNADGSGFHWLVQSAPSAHETEPHWSPDGKNVVFERTDGTLAIVPAGGGTITPMTNGHQPDWAPDGTKIAFSIGGQIHVIKPNGSEEASLTGGEDDAEPSWSPDGNRLAFVRHGRLWTMRADGSNQAQLLDAAAGSPAWSPAGDQIAYASGGTYVLDLVSGATARISNGGEPDWGTHPIVGPPPPAPPPPPPPPPALGPKCLVPNVVGKRVRVAKARLRARHCRSGKLTYRHVGVAKNGRVLKESPRAGTRMKNGAKVNLVVGHAARKT